MIYEMYQDKITDIYKDDDIYVFCSLITTVFAGFINYAITSLNILSSKGALNLFISWTEVIINASFFSTFFSKVI